MEIYITKNVALLLHSLIFFGFFVINVANAQSVDSTFLKQHIDEVVINEKSLEYNNELLALIENQGETLSDEIRFYMFNYTKMLNDTIQIENISGKFFIKFTQNKIRTFDLDTMGFFEVHYNPYSLHSTATCHIDFASIFWDNIIEKRINSRTYLLAHPSRRQAHTTKNLINDSVVCYTTYLFGFGNNPMFISLWNRKTGKVVSSENYCNLNTRKFIKGAAFPDFNYHSIYIYDDKGLIDSANVSFHYNDDNEYSEYYTLECIPFDSCSYQSHVFTRLNKKLIYNLRENKYDAKQSKN